MTEAKKYEYVLKAGTKLVSPEGEYTIKRVLGQGGYGITYKAEQRGLGRPVAIKEFFVSNLCDRNTTRSNACRLTRAWVWAGALSLAATRAISVDFSSSGYLDVSVPRVASSHRMRSGAGACA